MTMSGKQLTIAGLKALGFVRDMTARTSKYEVYVNANSTYTFLIGPSGAFRRVKKGEAIATSFSLTDSAKHKALKQLGAIAASLTTVEQARAAFSAFYRGSQPVPSAFNQPTYTDDTCVEPNQPC